MYFQTGRCPFPEGRYRGVRDYLRFRQECRISSGRMTARFLQQTSNIAAALHQLIASLIRRVVCHEVFVRSANSKDSETSCFDVTE